MQYFRDMSIRHKLILIIVSISSVSLLLAAIAFIATDRIKSRQYTSEKLGTMAEILGANSSAAILFGDTLAARETLGFLDAQEHIQAAAIYGPYDELFAGYKKPGMHIEFQDPGPHTDNILFWNDHVELFASITYEGERIGSIYLRSDMRELDERLFWFLEIVGAVLLVSLLVTFVLSARMQRIITDPLLRLSATARRVSIEENYSLRAAASGRDELGDLVSDFNTMLDEIQLRENELRKHKVELEDRVIQRTRELKIANLELEAAKQEAESVAYRMEYHAHHDALTGLPNRVLLTDRIAMEMRHARREHYKIALLFLDLDRFKIINDSLGHAVGDKLLRSVSHRIRDCVRDSDTVARLGGDEFMVLLPQVKDPVDVEQIANKIIGALDEPVSCDGNELHVTTSIGISIYPDDGTTVETLFRNADVSMYHAKKLGRNKAAFYSPQIDAGSRKQLELETSLRKALERKELELLYQPKVDISNNTIIGAEALIRWKHPSLGIINPMEFIPLAEDSGMIVPIGEWTLKESFRQLGEWHAAGHERLTIAVNLSSTQLTRPGLDKIVADALAESGIDPQLAELEVTENAAMQDIDLAISTLGKLKKMGITIAMDDFGTGYSSLSYLRRLPIDIVKIDQSFVREIPESREDALIAQAIIAMAQSLELSVVVEGIEHIRQLHFFRQQGCNSVQGELFSKPLTADALLDMLQNQALPGTLNLTS